jgi:hypothetical protein
MGRGSDAQHSFSGGEWSPIMFGRQDLEKYKSALATCLNARPLSQGPWTRREATTFINQARHHDKKCRLFRFEFSLTQSYIIEMGEFYFRFYTDDAVVTNTPQSVTSITLGNPTTVNKVAHGYTNGLRIVFSALVGVGELQSREFVVANAVANSFTINTSAGAAIDSTAFAAFVSGTMASIVETAHGFVESQLDAIRYTQANDVAYFMHPATTPFGLLRATATSWQILSLPAQDGPYLTINTTTTTLTPGAATGITSLTASSTTGINNNTGFQSTDVGRAVRVKEGSVWGWALITAFTNSTLVTINIQTTFTNVNAKTTWRLGLWSTTTGFPTVANFHEDRLWFSGVSTAPSRLDATKTGGYGPATLEFSPSAVDGTVANDNAISYVLNSSSQNRVLWLESDDKGLLVGTARSEWVVRASVQGEAITPVNVTSRPSTNRGSADIPAVRAGSTIVFVQHGGRKLRELAWVFEKDAFRAPDMTLLSEHITNPGVIRIAYQDQPQETVWAARSDGVLIGFTYERDQNVTAWHRHELGGFSDAGHTAVPVVEDMNVAVSADGTREELWMVIRRYINGGTVRYIERFSKPWAKGDLKEDALFLDCGKTIVNGSPTTALTGLAHLEGETVPVLADGAVHPDVTIVNAKATLNTTAMKATLGYAYPSDGMSLPVEAGAQDGTAQGKIKRLTRVKFILFDTLGLRYGPDANNLTEILNAEWGDSFGVATDLATGVFSGSFDGGYSRTGQCFWRASGPFPATILAYLPQVDTSDDS